MNPTPFADLNSVLGEFVQRTREILGQNFVGAYLQGSFAVGDADEWSDVDFLVITEHELGNGEVQALQAMHRRVYASESAWAQHLEGSYAAREQIRRVDASRSPYWYLDNGASELILDNHCNTAVVRWSLREHGVALAGPTPATLVDPVPADELRREALAAVREYVEWAPEPTRTGGMSRWKQPYLVLTYCRILHMLETGRVASKREAGEWARESLDARWRDLIQDALDARPNPWERVHQPAEAGDVARTLAFGSFALQHADVLFRAHVPPVAEHGDTSDRFDRISRVYGPQDHRLRDSLDASLEPRGPEMLFEVAGAYLGPESRILDIGCRDAGYLIRLVQTHACRGVGIDPVPANVDRSREAVAVAGLEGRIEIALGAIERIEQPDDHFDFVWCRDVLEVVADLEGGLAEAARVLRAGGRMLVYTNVATELLEPAEAERISGPLGGVPRNLDEGILEAAVDGAGLAVERKDVIGTEWREYEEERTRPVSQDLLRLARLRRRRAEIVEAHGREAYDLAEASLQWKAYQFLGKLQPVMYVLRHARHVTV